MSVEIQKVGEGKYTNSDRGMIVPVEGTFKGSPFKAEVYLGTAHNCTETQIIEGDPEILEDCGDITQAAQSCEAYVKFEQSTR